MPSSTVAHDGPATLGAFLARRAFYGTTAAPLARRHGDGARPRARLGLVAGRLGPAWPAARAGPGALAASVAILARRLRGLVRDPVAVAAHIAGGGTRARPCPRWRR